jgi:hypothetical protein
MSSFTNVDINKISDSDSESDEYIDLDEIVKEQDKEKNNIYQIQITEEGMMIKLVGKESYVPDVIIQENFGPDNKLSLYSCLYEEDDFILQIKKEDLENKSGIQDEIKEQLESNQDDGFYHPLIKLVERSGESYIIYSIVVKFKDLVFNTNIKDYELFIVFNKYSDDFVYTNPIEKNIDSKNIVEKIIEYYNHINDSKEYIKNNQNYDNNN